MKGGAHQYQRVVYTYPLGIVYPANKWAAGCCCGAKSAAGDQHHLLLLLNILPTGIMIAGYAVTDNLNKIISGSVVFILLLALMFLLLPSALKKYKVNNRT